MRAVNIIVPPDKSISHRAIMLASISKGATRIKNLLMGDDILRTIGAFRAMGVRILFEVKPRTWFVRGLTSNMNRVVVHGAGMRGLKKPAKPLYLGNSGTTMRILPGILAGQGFEAVLEGDRSLSKRPMSRIAGPLCAMGARVVGERCTVNGVRSEVYPPLKIRGGKLRPIKFKSKIASAQVKSCVLLAGLFARGVTSVSEPVKSRDHTERMLKTFGCRLQVTGNRVMIKGPAKLKSPGKIEIPGDVSSAAFFIVAGCILPNIKVVLKNVGLNPTRIGIIDILKRMGADIKVHSSRLTVHGSEPMGDIIVKSSKLKGVTISPDEVVRAIDEIPIIMVAACFAKGVTTIKGIGELRIKETDRIKSMVTNLRKLGADVRLQLFEVKPRTGNVRGLTSNMEEVVIKGDRPLHGATVSSFGDHRTAMSMLIANLAIKQKATVTGLQCINKSFPGFQNLLRKLN